MRKCFNAAVLMQEDAEDARCRNEAWPGPLIHESARWKAACSAAKGGTRVLITNAFGINPSVSHFDSLLAAALTIRGAEVHILYCDQALPACWNAQWDLVATLRDFAESGTPRTICDACFAGTRSLFSRLGLPVHPLRDLITPEDARRSKEVSSRVPYAAIEKYTLDGLSVGEHAYAGALRFLARGDLSEPYCETILRRYLDAALLSVYAIRRLRAVFPFDCLVALHGMYVPEGLFCEFARQQHARVVSWMFNYRKRTCTLSHGDTYARTLQSEPIESWQSMRWNAEMEASIYDYLESRRAGTRDWFRFVRNPQEDRASIEKDLGFDFSKPFVVMLTNVVWDARLYYPDNAFAGMMEWVLETIEYFAKRPDLPLVIRVHPAELVSDTQARQTVMSEIGRVFPRLPANVFIVPPESRTSTYSIASLANAVLVYGTTTGVEMAARGIPVIVAGDACLRNKGISLDASSRSEYLQFLDRLPLNSRLDAAATRRALQYAYHFFFRRMVPLPFTSGSPPKAAVRYLNEIVPGAHAGLDVVCNGILEGTDFVYPAELRPADVDADPLLPDRSALAQESFRIACKLGRIGEIDRMRAYFLNSLREYSTYVEEPWARSSISAVVHHLAIGSGDALSSIDCVRREANLLLRNCDLKRRLAVRRAFGAAIQRWATGLWKEGSYRQALAAFTYALLYDPVNTPKMVPRYLFRVAFGR
jgi:hypothetical protein